MAETSGDDRDQLREVTEAQAACSTAIGSLRTAMDRIGSARSWGTYDTWFGGGLFSSLIKHDRIGEAEEAMTQVDAALRRLRRELADVGVDGAAVGDVGVTDLTRSLDVWFDDFFSDFAVQSRLKDADRRLAEVARLLMDVSDSLAQRRIEIESRLSAS
ncbi:MAG TPA: hypothetical protein VH228_07030 [Nocardioides sp.]|nr:hypothetical protein [Nocardioides sp.]